MKKILITLVALLMLSSCNLFGPTISQGVYSCTTTYGTIYVELLTGDNCVIYFDGCKEHSGYYHTDGETFRLSGRATDWGETGKHRNWVSYSFGDSDGTITASDEFSIMAKVLYGSSDKTDYCHFVKRR